MYPLMKPLGAFFCFQSFSIQPSNKLNTENQIPFECAVPGQQLPGTYHHRIHDSTLWEMKEDEKLRLTEKSRV